MKRFLGLAILTLLAVPASIELVASGGIASRSAQREAGPTRMLRTPTISATHVAFGYANNIWVVERAGGDRPPAHQLPGPDDQPEVLARRDDHRLQRRLRRQRRRLHRAGRRRRAEAADLASRRRYRAGLDGRWRERDVRLRPRDLRAERDAAVLDRAGQGRRRRAVAVAARLPGQDLARRPAHRLSHEHLVGRGAPQLSRRPEPSRSGSSISRRSTWSRRRGPIRRTSIRCGSATPCSSSPIATAWPTCGRTTPPRKALTQRTKFIDYDVKSLDAGGGTVVFEQAGYLHTLDPEDRQDHAADHHRGRRLPVDDAALRGRHQPHDQSRHFGHRQARRGRGARRDLHHPGGEGRHPQHHQLQRLGRAPAGVVARRQVDLVLQRQVGRIQAGDRGAGRHRAAARDRVPEGVVLLHAGVVARFEEAALHRHQPERVGDGHRDRAGEDRRQRSVDGAAAHAGADVESRLEVGRVRLAPQHALSRHRRRQRRDRREDAGHRRPGRCDVSGVGRERQVPVVPRLHRLRPRLAVARHDVVRPAGDVRAVPGGAEEDGSEPAAARER